MEDDEDDFYGGGGNGVKQEEQVDADEKEEKMDVSEDGSEEDDSDDDVQFTLEKPEGAKAEPPPGSKAARQQAKNAVSAVKEEKAKSSTPAVKSEAQRAGSAAPPTAVKGTLTHNGKEGQDFPEIRTSKLDVNAIPTWPANGKPITELDIDADLAEHSKPWRLPGTDQTDFFNYGFDEYTWTQYTIRQQSMSDTINQQKQEDAQMKALFGNTGGDGQPGGMGGMGGMPQGMQPDPQMAKMAQDMGVPLEFFMQMMQQNGGMPGMRGGPGMGMGGQQGQFNQQGGDFGSGQNSVSPQPQAGQGFQPPSGPSGGGQQGQQGGFNMEGFSPQQIAIMQQEQQGGHMGGGGGGGGRGGRRRGRW
ncbi:Pre-mRNA polyadenylation factor fip1 [Pseudocercospora fuligena]|uniref:Pre-mRNA polyadenylation factor fip1 n=1 Tax=Pseudocercospora fuligena TaxID=685502 RepID=A0A8H6RN75_9PEZI|nr:Pre-mRNA polyadenylation factor fip1 [Pseudocercospora fuligena]